MIKKWDQDNRIVVVGVPRYSDIEQVSYQYHPDKPISRWRGTIENPLHSYYNWDKFDRRVIDTAEELNSAKMANFLVYRLFYGYGLKLNFISESSAVR